MTKTSLNFYKTINLFLLHQKDEKIYHFPLENVLRKSSADEVNHSVLTKNNDVMLIMWQPLGILDPYIYIFIDLTKRP